MSHKSELRAATARPQLVHKVSVNDPTALEDLLVIIMWNIEDGLIQAGATPGTDYTYRDLLTAAMPLVSHMFKREGNPITFTTNIPPMPPLTDDYR